jgi:protease IV
MRQFLKTVLASFLGLVLFSAIGAGGLTILVLAAASRADKPSKPKLLDKTVLVYDLSLNITDTPPADGISLEDAIGNKNSGLGLRSVLDSLKAAAQDEHIVALYLKNEGGVSAGYATLKEIRSALEAFRKAGKPIYAYGTDWDERDYYLGSIANEITINPIGDMTLNGLSSETRFYTGAMEKFGVGVQVIRVGKFKAAVEPYTQKAFSPANRQQTQALLNDIWDDFLTSVSRSRQLQTAQMRAITDKQPVLTAKEALSRKLIDHINHPDEIDQKLRQLTNPDDKADDKADDKDLGEKTTAPKHTNPKSPAAKSPDTKDSDTKDSDTKDSDTKDSDTKDSDTKDSDTKDSDTKDPEDFRSISLSSYVQMTEDHQKTEDDRIAILYAEGDIVSGEGDLGNVIGSDTVISTLKDIEADDAVKAVVLRVNSPGGGATAASLIGHELAKLAKQKPLIVSMGDYAASGGYWIAAPAQHIFAEPTTITGSIGTFSLLPNFQTLANRNGITWDSVNTSPFANTQTNTRPKSEAEMAILQKTADNIYDQFLTLVSSDRKLPRAKVEDLAQGRVWSGKAAQQIGLVDEVGGLSEAIAYAAKTAKLKTWSLDEYPHPRSFEAELYDRFFSQSPLAALFPQSHSQQPQFATGVQREFRGIQKDLEQLTLLNDPKNTYTRLPYNLEIH